MRQCNDHVGIFRSGVAQGAGRGGIAAYGAQIVAILQELQAWPILVDDGDVVFFIDQAFGDTGADLASTDDDDFHGFTVPAALLGFVHSSPRRPKRTSNCFSLR